MGGGVWIILREGEIGVADFGGLEVWVAERLAAAEVQDGSVFADAKNSFADHDVVMFAGGSVAVGQDSFAADGQDFFGVGDFSIEEEVVVVGGLDAAAAADGGVTGFAEDDVGTAEDER